MTYVGVGGGSVRSLTYIDTVEKTRLLDPLSVGATATSIRFRFVDDDGREELINPGSIMVLRQVQERARRWPVPRGRRRCPRSLHPLRTASAAGGAVRRPPQRK